MKAILAWSKTGSENCTASPENFGRIATAGTSARTRASAKAAKIQPEIAGPLSGAPAGARSRNDRPAAAANSTPAPITTPGENPVHSQSGSITALCTAQPITGAEPSASTRGSR